MDNNSDTLSRALQEHQAGNLLYAESLYRELLRGEPGNLEALKRLAVLSASAGRPAECVSLCRCFLSIQPNSAEMTHVLALAHLALGNFVEAVAAFQECIRLKPDFVDALNNLGFVHTSRGEPDKAIPVLEKALALRPQNTGALNNLGIAYYKSNRIEDAIQAFRKSLELAPAAPETLKNLGNAFLGLDRLPEARDCYRQALQLRPNDAATYNNLAALHVKLDQWDSAEACYRRSRALNPRDPEPVRHLAQLQLRHGKLPEAAAYYRELLLFEPGNLEVRLLVESLSQGSSLDRLPAEYTAALYNRLAGSFEKDLVERLGYCSPRLLKNALSSPNLPKTLDILDLGCGTGLCGLEFRDWARTLVGVDLSPEMLLRAKERSIYDQLLQSDLLQALQSREQAHDLILASDVLLYFGDLSALAQAVFRTLKRGGRFAFTIDRHDGTGYRFLPFLHFAHSRSYIQEIAAAARLRETHSEEVVFPREGGESARGWVMVWERAAG